MQHTLQMGANSGVMCSHSYSQRCNNMVLHSIAYCCCISTYSMNVRMCCSKAGEHTHPAQFLAGDTAASESHFLPSTGIIIGVVLRYAIPPQGQPEYYLAARDDNCSERTELLAGERIELISFTGDNDTEERFICQVVGRVFRTSQGNYIQQTVCACRL